MTEVIEKTERPRVSTTAGFLVLAIASCGVYAIMNRTVESNIEWGDNLTEAQAAATRLGTGVLINFTTDGCVHCVRMERNVMPEPQVEQAVAQFVPVKLHWPKDGEIAMRYGVEMFPTFLVIAPDGKPILGAVGYVPTDEFTRFLQQAARDLSAGVSAGS